MTINPLTIGAICHQTGGGGGGTGDPHWAQVVGMFDFDGVNGATSAHDFSVVAVDLAQRGGGVLSNGRSKWGATSLRVAGSNDAMFDNSNNIARVIDATAGRDFTFEYWLWVDNASTTVNMAYFDVGLTGNYILSPGQLHFYNNGAELITSANNVILSATWQFIAISRTSGVHSMYVDGTLIGTNSAATAYGSGDLYAGGILSGGNTMTGNISDLRFTVGVGRYPSTCPVPTAAFPHF